GSLALMAQTGMGTAHQVQGFGIRWPVVQKTFERISSVLVLSGCIVGGPYLAPDFMLAERRIPDHYLLKILNCVSESLLRTRDSSQLVMRIDLIRVNLNCPFKALAGGIKFTSLLVN